MSLFKNEDAPCPVCGNPTARILPMKVEGQPICKECKNAISMENELERKLTVESLKQHIEYRKQNSQKLKEFNKSQTYPLGGGSIDKKLFIDGGEKEWYVEGGVNPPIFKFDEFRGFEINENNKKIECGDRNGWKSVDSGVYTELTTLAQRLAEAATPEERNAIKEPVKDIEVTFLLNNPYWKKYTVNLQTPSLDPNDPAEYLKEYTKTRSCMAAAVANLMERCLGVKVTLQPYTVGFSTPAVNASAAVSNGSIGVADELIKYKQLLDSGAITVAEYNTLKDNLLGK